MNSETYLVTRRGIPMIKITKARKSQGKALTKNNLKKAKKAVDELFGMWKYKWRGKTTEKISEMLAEKAWNSHAS